jgi:hypothetical protein
MRWNGSSKQRMMPSNYSRGEWVQVLTDPSPRPNYVVLTTEPHFATIAQISAGFIRKVPLTELVPVFSWNHKPS